MKFVKVKPSKYNELALYVANVNETWKFGKLKQTGPGEWRFRPIGCIQWTPFYSEVHEAKYCYSELG